MVVINHRETLLSSCLPPIASAPTNVWFGVKTGSRGLAAGVCFCPVSGHRKAVLPNNRHAGKERFEWV
jgi:hypothetical protein